MSTSNGDGLCASVSKKASNGRALMKDEFAGNRLPDLPDAGYSTRRERTTTDLVMFWLRGIERNRPLLLAIVIDGIDKWRKTAGKAWGLSSAGRATAMSRELLDRVFDYMRMLAGENPAQQLLILHGQAEQADRARWDKRQSTQQKAARELRARIADLTREQHKPRKLYS